MADDMDTSHNPAQLEMWKLLGDTKAVVSAMGERLVRPGKVVEPHAASPARLEAQMRDRGRATGALDLGKLPGGRMPRSETPYASAGTAKVVLTVAPAKYGNRAVIRRRD